MSEEQHFRELIGKVRAGNAEAAAELVKHYEPSIRRLVRMRMRDRRLRRAFDSSDMCQSVLGSFFVRVALGQYELDGPEDLIRLLAIMARNKVARQARRADIVRRDQRGLDAADFEGSAFVAGDPSPSRIISQRDLVEHIRQCLSPEERRLAEQRAEGRSWLDIAAELGRPAEALRKQLARALDRVSHELHLAEATDD
jgi:RNA polymerase sigma factor (sigma-70 family)